MAKTVLAAILVLSYGAQAYAYDFTAADEAFNARAQGASKIAEARSGYEAALPQVSGDEKIYAVEQIGKLAYYESLLATTSKDQTKKVTQECYDLTSQISPDAIHSQVPQYYYWRSVCLSVWGVANGVLASLGRSAEVASLFEEGIKVDSTYEGGGFYRLGAAVYLKLPPINPVGPSGDVRKAADYADKAIASPAYAGAIDPATSTGDYYYNAFEYKAEILLKQGNKAKAIEVLDGAIRRIESGDLPVGREAETAEQLRTLKELRSQLH